MTADRGYGEATVDQELHALGVARVAIPRKGQPGPVRRAIEHTRGFRELVRWRTGCEGRISQLKHRYGWDRTRMDGIDGARIWCGHGSSPTTWSESANCWRPGSNRQRELGHRVNTTPSVTRWHTITAKRSSGRSN